MRILILTQYYPPETGAPQNRLSDLSRRLGQLGHSVTVLTALPNYPKGRVFAGFRGRVVTDDRVDGIRIVRTWVYATADKRLLPRLAGYLSFALSSVLLGLRRVGAQEVVLVESPPLFLGISGVVTSWWKRARLVFNVSDLWPESAIAMGLLRNPLLVRLSTGLEEFIYKRSHLITGQTLGIVDNIKARFPSKHVELITNGVDVAAFESAAQRPRRERTRAEFGLGEGCVVGYAGLHGLAQGLDAVIEAARLLRDQTGITFVLFGDGPEKSRLIQLARQQQLPNVQFLPTQGAGRMADILSTFDIAVIPLRDLPLFRGALPSKMFEAMAAGVPIVVSVDGEARGLTKRSRAGICVPPENAPAIAKAIRRLSTRPDLRRSMGSNGRRFVTEHYNRQHIGAKFERLMTGLLVPARS